MIQQGHKITNNLLVDVYISIATKFFEHNCFHPPPAKEIDLTQQKATSTDRPPTAACVAVCIKR